MDALYQGPWHLCLSSTEPGVLLYSARGLLLVTANIHLPDIVAPDD